MLLPLEQQASLIEIFFDSNYAEDSSTRRSRTGFIEHLDNSPIFACSKKQGSYKISSVGSEIIAMESCCDNLRGLRNELRVLAIPVEYPACALGSN